MDTKMKIMDVAGFDIIKVTEDEVFVRYFAQQNGKAVTDMLGSIDAVRSVLELLEARKSSEWVANAMPLAAASVVAPQSILLYPLGKLLLRIITWGRYPPKSGVPHNSDFVLIFPGLVLAAIFVVITVVYS